MAVFGADNDTIEGGVGHFQFQPGEAAASGHVKAGGVLDHEAFVLALAGLVEGVGDFVDGVGLGDLGEAKVFGQRREGFEFFAALLQRMVQIIFAIQPEEVESDVFDGDFFLHEEVALSAAETFLEIGKWEGTVATHGEDFAVEDEIDGEVAGGIGEVEEGGGDVLEVAGIEGDAVIHLVELAADAVVFVFEPDWDGAAVPCSAALMVGALDAVPDGGG